MAARPGAVLVINAGSSSIKVAVFGDGGAAALRGTVAGIGGAARLTLGDVRRAVDAPDHDAALAAVLAALRDAGVALHDLAAAAHRIVHGGAELTAPCRITAEVLDRIAACAALAPLHTPHALAAIRAIARQAPDLPQCASFDTAFHATIPDVATRYALPEEPATRGLRRFGFHGLSYHALTRDFTAATGLPLPERLLACHLGNGASLCAIRGGQSVATTMGYDPLSGLTMSTRAGEIDAGAVLALAERLGVDGARDLLGRRAGLAGLSGGKSDMRALLADDGPAEQAAVAHFLYWAARAAGSMIAAMGGIDGIAFTGGIGENAAPVRARLAAALDWTGLHIDTAANDRAAPCLHRPDSAVTAVIVPANEERLIADQARAALARQPGAEA
jgi:acetate kinase